jgi:hypothetical protein
MNSLTAVEPDCVAFPSLASGSITVTRSTKWSSQRRTGGNEPANIALVSAALRVPELPPVSIRTIRVRSMPAPIRVMDRETIGGPLSVNTPAARRISAPGSAWPITSSASWC